MNLLVNSTYIFKNTLYSFRNVRKSNYNEREYAAEFPVKLNSDTSFLQCSKYSESVTALQSADSVT